MLSQIRPAIVSFIMLTIITGVLYPLAVTGVAAVAMPGAATGSMMTADGKIVGSELIGQPFSDPKYFWSRPSATSPVPYAGDAGAGSNQAPSNPALVDAVKGRVAALKAADPENQNPVPIELVTASGSGLDPHISPAAAEYQVSRVAKARGLSPEQVRAWVAKFTQSPTFGVLGDSRVHVLKLNLALDGK